MNTTNQINITTLRNNISGYINQVTYTGVPISIQKNNKTIAQIIPYQEKPSTSQKPTHPAFGIWSDLNQETNTLEKIRQKAWNKNS